MITYRASLETMALTKDYAESATLGGTSQIPGESVENRFTDNWVGQLGEAAGHHYLFSTLSKYKANREGLRDKWEGDGGSDVPGYRIDFKASLHRHSNKRPETYTLIVRPAELHDDTAYVLIVVEPNCPTGLTATKETGIYLVGWAYTRELAPSDDWGGIAMVRGGTLLRPMIDLRLSIWLKE